MLNKIRQYLSDLTVSVEQKRYAMSFCKKIKYLNELHSIAIQDVNDYVCTGYGNVNSKTCLIFKDKTSYDVIKPLIQEIMDKLNINSWDVYITFVNKTKDEYNKKYSFLVNEVHAIGPKLLYVFDNNTDIYNQIIDTFNVYNISLPEKHFMINIQDLYSSDEKIRKDLWNMLKYLINYKELKKEE